MGTVEQLLESAGWEKQEAYSDSVYACSTSKVMFVVGEEKTLILSGSHAVLSTLQNADHFSVLGACLFLKGTITPCTAFEQTLGQVIDLRKSE